MNELLISKKHQIFTYELKEGTNSSYQLKEGEKNILPERIGYTKEGFLKLQNKGRVLTELKKGQIIGTFKQSESSPYKVHKPYRIFSSIWAAKGHTSFLGYGDIGVSNSEGRITAGKDLFIAYKPYEGILQIHLFYGLVEWKEEVLNYLEGYIKAKALERAC